MATVIQSNWGGELGAILQGFGMVHDIIQNRALHNRYTSQLEKYLGDFESEKKAGSWEGGKKSDDLWKFTPEQESMLKGTGEMEPQRTPDGGFTWADPTADKRKQMFEELMSQKEQQGISDVQQTEQLDPQQISDLKEKYRMMADVASSNYPREMRIPNPFGGEDGLSFDEKMQLAKARISGRGSEPTVYYNPTTKKRGNAQWAMSKENEGMDVYPLGKEGLNTVPGKKAGVAISETKLFNNFSDNPNEANTIALNNYLNSQGKELDVPGQLSVKERFFNYFKGIKQPKFAIKEVDGVIQAVPIQKNAPNKVAKKPWEK
jgi:hypothetical protein